MDQLLVGVNAPDFELPDHTGTLHRLSELLKTKNALLVFNIGFAWPHCTNHMAQLRHDYVKFTELNCEVLVMVPNGPRMIERYVSAHNSPYPILSDKGSVVAGQYLQVKRYFKIGAPTVVLVDQQGRVAYTHYGISLITEPDNREPLAVLEGMSSASK